ncbi:unnamed protein product [Cylicocyclus nassatus]|uniref:Uncharacterized protein n=1 Tax=Cylicocyclus nassatus TaxID=53992 RepID=A0AA36HGT5_CYLNA|nr:unnamed protein product [Cylicocyclus nassatus]
MRDHLSVMCSASASMESPIVTNTPIIHAMCMKCFGFYPASWCCTTLMSLTLRQTFTCDCN